MKLNKDWHEANPMPVKADPEQRFEWHVQHQKACACRPMPSLLKKQAAARGFVSGESLERPNQTERSG
jgi:hypothetical protein